MLAKFLVFSLIFAACAAAQSPKLLLSPQHLKRLQRDRERQTDRWLSFEHHVQTVPDSPERGFELALYYAVTNDEPQGREALQWAVSHPCEVRQVALVIDWVAPLVTAADRAQVGNRPCPNYHPGRIAQIRDTLFMKTALGETAVSSNPSTTTPDIADPDELYAALEFSAAKNARGDFSDTAANYLLSFHPAELDHPNWRQHIIALALVSLDPNAQVSQFLQGWAMEDRFTIRDGPGVAYEFLWANPYLPGVSYQNMDPWVYDEKGLLLARGGWSQSACWIEVTAAATSQQNCPPGWESQTVVFGHLTLIPMTDKCAPVERAADRKESCILWKLKPHAKVAYTEDNQSRSSEADAAGMWRVPSDVGGKVCVHR